MRSHKSTRSSAVGQPSHSSYPFRPNQKNTRRDTCSTLNPLPYNQRVVGRHLRPGLEACKLRPHAR